LIPKQNPSFSKGGAFLDPAFQVLQEQNNNCIRYEIKNEFLSIFDLLISTLLAGTDTT